jgi:DUF4097 and DUF4098 domain-containing protein YvlB
MRNSRNLASLTGIVFGTMALLVGLAVRNARAEDFERTVARTSGWTSRAMRFSLDQDGRTVRLTGTRSSWLGGLGSGRVEVRVRTPQEFSLDLRTSGGRIDVQEVNGQVKATTSGGSIELDRITGGIEVNTSGGNIRVLEIEGDVSARTSGGSIHASEVNGRVEVRTSGGSLRIRDVGGDVEAKTRGGSISVRFTGAPSGRLETSGGSIEVELPEGEGIDLDARTSGGRVEIADDFAIAGHIERERVEAKVNGGGKQLRLRTSGGNIRVGLR